MSYEFRLQNYSNPLGLGRNSNLYWRLKERLVCGLTWFHWTTAGSKSSSHIYAHTTIRTDEYLHVILFLWWSTSAPRRIWEILGYYTNIRSLQNSSIFRHGTLTFRSLTSKTHAISLMLPQSEDLQTVRIASSADLAHYSKVQQVELLIRNN